jgi:hypothetical protein
MKKQELSETKYNIRCRGRKIYSSLTEEEYFEIMEDLSIQYYQTGTPHPDEIETEIIGKHWSFIKNGKVKGWSE